LIATLIEMIAPRTDFIAQEIDLIETATEFFAPPVKN
jgi:hypothetical protein